MDINKKKNRKQISTFHAAEVMSHDLSLLRGKKFPTFFGAITKSQIKKINNFPLEISYCIKCNLVQQTKPISEKYMNEVYNSKYYNCPSPLKSGMGLREIHKFWNFFN